MGSWPIFAGDAGFFQQTLNSGRLIGSPGVTPFLKVTVAEWAYSMSFQTSTERNRWLPRYLAIYNGRRCHMALAGRTPIQQLGLLRSTE